jgi:hypothetical protein
MAINFTVYTTITWAQAKDQNVPALSAARNTKLTQMVAENKTDGINYAQSPTTNIRDWLDTAAAQEYVDWQNAECATLGITIPTHTISPING